MVFMTKINSIGTANHLISRENLPVRKSSGQDTITSPKSSKVILSDDAKVIAKFANKGISVSLKHKDKPVNFVSDGHLSTSDFGKNINIKNISKVKLDELLLKLGATDLEREQIKTGLDNNNDQSISNGELMRVIANTQEDSLSLSKIILGLMDRNGDQNGKVNLNEFARVTTALNDLEG